MKTVFIGAVEGSKVALDALIKAGIPPALVITLPPDQASRHSDYADLTGMANSAGCKVLFTSDINSDDVIGALRLVEPDLCLVIGWSQICKERFRAIAKHGNIGFHPSPLPRFRGRAVIPWTILQGETSSGSTLFWLDEGTDSGAILLQKIFPVAHDETAQSLYSKHVRNLSAMLPDAVRLVESGKPPRTHQNAADASYCAKRTPEDGIIDWHQPSDIVLRFVRAVGIPYPGAFAFCGGEKLFIDKAVPFSDSQRFIGLTGQVQSHTPSGFSVRCDDGNLIEVLKWRWKPSGKPRVHAKLVGSHQ
jgi:methionyl-tRNA formyltransferase